MKFNGGGHLNHEFFWQSLIPIAKGGGVLPPQESILRRMIEREWGSFDAFQTYFAKQSANL